MAARCIICTQPAIWMIRGTGTAYCDEHAKEFFSDTSYLASIENEAKNLKAFVDDVAEESEEEKDEEE